jgi:methionyl-tRNA synthetase
MEQFASQRALSAIWGFIGVVNGYIDTTQPWAMAKQESGRERLDVVLYTLGESLRFLGIVLSPFIPEAATKIRATVGSAGEPRLADAIWGRLAAGTPVQKLSGLFPRVDTGTRAPGPQDQQGNAATGASVRPPADVPGLASGVERPAASHSHTGLAALATTSDFAKLDLRVVEVVAAEAVPKSKKLLKLTVSLGGEQRTVVAGIAEHYAPADLVGKKVVIVANLEAARLMGIESQGMVLAGSAEGRLAVLTLDRDLPPGAKVS